nr:hypothetical protein [Tanacetum cinerariifolium]
MAAVVTAIIITTPLITPHGSHQLYHHPVTTDPPPKTPPRSSPPTDHLHLRSTSTITTAATNLAVIVTTSLRRHHLHPTVTTTTQPPLSTPTRVCWVFEQHQCMSQFIMFPMTGGVRIGKGTALMANEAIAQHTTAPLAFREGLGSQGQSCWQEISRRRNLSTNQKEKITSMSFALSESKRDDSTRSEGDTRNSLDNAESDTEVNFPHSTSSPHSEQPLQSQHSTHSDKDTHANSGGDGLYHDEKDEHIHRHASGSIGHVLSSSFDGSGLQCRSIVLVLCLHYKAWSLELYLGLLSGVFHPSSVYSFELPFPLSHMYFGSQSASDPVIPKFNMHIYSSVLTVDEVKSLVKEYTIPLDLRPCVPPFTLTMNKLPGDKIAWSLELYLGLLSGVR